MSMTVSIGRNVNGKPMSDAQWESFTADILRNVRSNTQAIYFVGFGTGTYEGDSEESFTVVSSNPTTSALCAIEVSLSLFAHAYKQESIALTVGATEFVLASHR